jgi:signal transduction histidine kinase
MTRNQKLVALAGAIATGYVIAAPWIFHHDAPISILDHASHISVGVAFLVVGLVAWRRRPENTIGPLMCAVGLSWYIVDLTWTHNAAVWTLGQWLQPLPNGFLMHTFIAFPSGRVRNIWERRFLVFVYVWLVGQSLAAQAFWNPRSDGCTCPKNLLLIHGSQRLNDAISKVGSYAVFFLALITVLFVARHYRRGSVAGRRVLAPVVWVAGPVGAFAVVRYVTESIGVGNNVFEPIWITWNFSYVLLPLALLAGLARASLGRLAVSDLVVRLSKPLAPGELEDALSKAMGDPSVEVLYWLPDTGAYVDDDGERAALPAANDPARAYTVVEREGATVGALVYDASLREEAQRVEGVVAAAELALDNERLHAEVRAQLEEVRASRSRIVEAGDIARRRVERDLHDGAQQRLVALSLALGMAEQRAKTDARLHEILAGASGELRDALAELRELARGMYPAILTDAGLEPALHSLAGRSPVPVDVSCSVKADLSEPIAATAYYVAAEALTNVAKYAGATSATLRVGHANGRLVIEIGDDGAGGADASKGSGLRGLADRVEAMNGRLHVESAPGRGTRVVAEIPCE